MRLFVCQVTSHYINLQNLWTHCIMLFSECACGCLLLPVYKPSHLYLSHPSPIQHTITQCVLSYRGEQKACCLQPQANICHSPGSVCSEIIRVQAHRDTNTMSTVDPGAPQYPARSCCWETWRTGGGGLSWNGIWSGPESAIVLDWA